MEHTAQRHIINVGTIQLLDGRPNWKTIKRLRLLYERGDMLELTSHFGSSHARDIAAQLDIIHMFTWK